MQHTITHNGVNLGTVEDFKAGGGRTQWFARLASSNATAANRDSREEAEADLHTWHAGGQPAYREALYLKKDPLEDLVKRFAAALLDKLQAARVKYGYENDGFLANDWEAHCRYELLCHIDKGDPRDVAAYCAFMWHHGWSTTPTPTIAEVVNKAIDAKQAAVKDAVADVLRQIRQPVYSHTPGSYNRNGRHQQMGMMGERERTNTAADTLARQYGVELGPWPETSTQF